MIDFYKQLQENNITEVCNEIMQMWLKCKTKEVHPVPSSSENVDIKLAKLLESQTLATTKQKQYTEEEKKIREAILSQYSQMTDDEDEEDDVNPCSASGDHNGFAKNTNAHAVAQAEKERREQARLDSQKKKEKDKEDRLVVLLLWSD